MVAGGVALDLLTKQAVLARLLPHDPVAVAPSVNLTLGFNAGIAFGLAPAESPMATALLLLVQIGLVAMLAWFLTRAPNMEGRVAFGLLIAGALGNMLDRVPDGLVTDFIDLYWRNWRWPAFNVADILICLGVALLILSPRAQAMSDSKRSAS